MEEQCALLDREPSPQPVVMVFKACAWRFCVLWHLIYCFPHASVLQDTVRGWREIISRCCHLAMVIDWTQKKHPLLAPFISRVMSRWLTQDKATDGDGEGGRNHPREKPGAGVWHVLGTSLLGCHACLLSPFLSSSPPLPLAASLNDIWNITMLTCSLNECS